MGFGTNLRKTKVQCQNAMSSFFRIVLSGILAFPSFGFSDSLNSAEQEPALSNAQPNVPAAIEQQNELYKVLPQIDQAIKSGRSRTPEQEKTLNAFIEAYKKYQSAVTAMGQQLIAVQEPNGGAGSFSDTFLANHFNLDRIFTSAWLNRADLKSIDLIDMQSSSGLVIPAQAYWGNGLPNDYIAKHKGNHVHITMSLSRLIQLAVQKMLNSMTQETYVPVAKCLLSAYLIDKYAQTITTSATLISSNWHERLKQVFANQDSCFATSSAQLITESVQEIILNSQSKMVQAVAMMQLRGPEAILPPEIQTLIAQTKLEGATWTDILVAPEAEIAKTVQPMADALAKLPESIIPKSSEYLLAVDDVLVQDLLKLANQIAGDKKINISANELRRRLRIGQLGLLAPLSEQFMTAVLNFDAKTLEQTLRQTRSDLSAVSLHLITARFLSGITGKAPKNNEIEKPLEAIVTTAIDRHGNRLKQSSDYKAYIDQSLRMIVEAQQTGQILTQNQAAVEQRLKRVSLKISEKTGRYIKDENLEYSAKHIIQAFWHEIQSHPGRLEDWFKIILSDTAFKTVLVNQQLIEKHITKNIPAGQCRLEPYPAAKAMLKTTGYTGWMVDLYDHYKGSWFGGHQLSDTQRQDLFDCQAFILYSTVTGIRLADLKAEPPKTMEPLIRIMDKYLGVELRKQKMNLYRKLLQSEEMQANGILSLTIGDESLPLFEALAEGGGIDAFRNSLLTVIKNIETTLMQVAQSKTVQDLKPFIVRASYLDAVFGAKDQLTELNLARGGFDVKRVGLQTVASQSLQITGPRSMAPITDDDVDPRLWGMTVAATIHTKIKDQLVVEEKAKEGYSQYVATDMFEPFWILVVATGLRRMIYSRYQAADPVSNFLLRFQDRGATLARGYMSMFTLYFIGDFARLQFYAIPELEESTAAEKVRYYTELTNDSSTGLISFLQHIDNAESLSLRLKQAVIQRNTNLILSALPAAFLVIPRFYNSLTKTAALEKYRKMDRKLADLYRSSPSEWEKQIDTLYKKSAAQLRRFYYLNKSDFELLGINHKSFSVGAEAEAQNNSLQSVLHPRNLQKQLDSIITNPTMYTNVQAQLAEQAYFRLIRQWYMETLKIQQALPTNSYLKSIYAQLYFGRQATARDFQELTNEYVRVQKLAGGHGN